MVITENVINDQVFKVNHLANERFKDSSFLKEANNLCQKKSSLQWISAKKTHRPSQHFEK